MNQQLFVIYTDRFMKYCCSDEEYEKKKKKKKVFLTLWR